MLKRLKPQHKDFSTLEIRSIRNRRASPQLAVNEAARNRWLLRVIAHRSAEALLSLYKPTMEKAARGTKAYKIASKTSFTHKSDFDLKQGLERLSPMRLVELGHGFDAYYHPATKRIRMTSPSVSSAVHEVSHALGVSKNNKAVATAFEEYMSKMRLERAGFSHEENFNSVSARTTKPDIEGAFRKLTRRFSLLEHKTWFGKEANSALGRELGYFAFQFERTIKKPGAGMFFIREVSLGRGINETLRLIASGKFDAEIKHWNKVNFDLKPLLEDFVNIDDFSLLE